MEKQLLKMVKKSKVFLFQLIFLQFIKENAKELMVQLIKKVIMSSERQMEESLLIAY